MRSVHFYYPVGPEAEAVLTLLTRPERLERDMAALGRLAAGARPCSLIVDGTDGPFRQGQSAPCPSGALHF